MNVMTTDLVCPNCGSDRRYRQDNRAARFRHGLASDGNTYTCLKCGFHYKDFTFDMDKSRRHNIPR